MPTLAPAPQKYFAATCTFDVTVTDEDATAAVRFFKVPGPAHDALGSLVILWGDGSESLVVCEASRDDIETMMETADAFPTAEFSHAYGHAGVFHVTIGCPSGFVPLARLPLQTTAITSALPTLTIGETDERGRLLPSDTLPPLVPAPPSALPEEEGAAGDAEASDDATAAAEVEETAAEEPPAPAYSALASIPADLLANNPHLAYFDDAFAGSQIAAVSPDLFAPVKRIDSARRLFAGSKLDAVPAGFLSHVHEATAVEKAFANCPQLTSVADPFAPAPVPPCAEGLLAGAPLPLFAAFPRDLRADLGCVRPAATTDDAPFTFFWHASPQAAGAPIVYFYPTDFAESGDFFIDWGDGTTESVAWNDVSAITHEYASDGVYQVTLFSTPNEPVRPFRLGRFVTEIASPLPAFFPRNVTEKGNFCGWAADARELVRVPSNLFDAIGKDVTNLDEAFAGCTALSSAPDSLFAFVNASASVDGAFAFCKKLSRLPASYANRPRRTERDYFAPCPAPVAPAAPETPQALAEDS